MFENINNLMKREVTRKEFLMYLGLFLLALSGISNVLKSFHSSDFSLSQKQNQHFGSGSYGGKKA